MENEVVEKAINTEIEGLSAIMLGNPASHLEMGSDGSWTLYKTKPDWEKEESDTHEEITSSDEYDFPGISGVSTVDMVLVEAMIKALQVTVDLEP